MGCKAAEATCNISNALGSGISVVVPEVLKRR